MKNYPVKVNQQEALRYLGFQGHPADETVAGQLRDAIALLKKTAAPSYTYKVCELIRNVPLHEAESGQAVTGTGLKGTSVVLSGSSADSFLENCHSCIMMAVTIGRRVDTEIHRRQITDMAGAVILDSCASSAIESVCEQLTRDLENEYKQRGLYLTDRFSPGYGDLPLALQPEICRALSAEKSIGLSITGGMLLMPTKSVTAFIGISDQPRPKKLTGCQNCLLNATCNFRKAGTTCAD